MTIRPSRLRPSLGAGVHLLAPQHEVMADDTITILLGMCGRRLMHVPRRRRRTWRCSELSRDVFGTARSARTGADGGPRGLRQRNHADIVTTILHAEIGLNWYVGIGCGLSWPGRPPTLSLVASAYVVVATLFLIIILIGHSYVWTLVLLVPTNFYSPRW